MDAPSCVRRKKRRRGFAQSFLQTLQHILQTAPRPETRKLAYPGNASAQVASPVYPASDDDASVASTHPTSLEDGAFFVFAVLPFSGTLLYPTDTQGFS